MIPIDQTKVGPVEGNCWAACIASILELPIEEVPNFVVEYEGEYLKKTEEWINGLVKTRLWLKGHELGLVTVHCGNSPLGCIGTTYWIGVGKSPRGPDHAVVYHGEDLVHDPHPDKTGLEGIPWSGSFFVLRNPRFRPKPNQRGYL
jgi:hypothetical protein